MIQFSRRLKFLWILMLASSMLACRLAIQGVQPSVPLLPISTATSFVTRTPSPAPTRTPTFTPVPSATPTLTSTPTPILLVGEGTPLPKGMHAITLENAGQVSALVEWSVPSVSDISWTPDGEIMAVASAARIDLVHLDTRQTLRSLYPTKEGIIDVEFSPGGLWLVVGSRQGDEKTGYASSLELWAGPNWKPLGLLYGVAAGLSAISFAPHSDIFAAAYTSPLIIGDNTIDFWNVSTWTINTSMQTGTVLNIAFSPDGVFLAISPDRYAVQVWDVTRHEFLYRIRTSFTGAINTMTFSPDGLVLATGHYDGMVRLWDIETGELLVEFGAGALVQSLAFSPDGQILASGGSFESSMVQLWSAGSGSLLRSLENSSGGITHLLFSPDSKYLVSASYDGTLRLWGIRP